MTRRVESWVFDGASERRRGRPDRPFDPGFISGVTRPTTSNTGCRLAEADLPEVIGTVTLSTPGQVYENRLVRGRIIVAAPGVVIRDVIVDVIPPAVAATDSTVVHGITSWTASSTATIEHVTIRARPEVRNWRCVAGLHGSGIDARRVHIWGMTDGFIMSGTNKRSYARLRDYLIRDMPKYDYDGHSSHPSHPSGVSSFPGSHSDGSHNDGIQVQGNLTEVLATGGEVGTGSTATILVTQDAGTYDTGPVFTDNWFPVGDPVFGSIFNVKLSDPAIPGLTLKRNRFTARDLARARIIMSSAQLAAASITSDGADRNVWLPESGVTLPTTNVPIYRGPGVTPSNLYTYGSAA